MKINIQNYETILIDYFDGKLNPLEVAEVILFLEQHPEIKRQFEGLSTIPTDEQFGIDPDFKDNLKIIHKQQAFQDQTFDEIFIAQLEGDCTAEESILIDKLIQKNKALKKLKYTFLLTKLKPDSQITFPNKALLKKRETPIFYLYKKFVAAAVLTLITALIFLIYNHSGKQEIINSLVSSNRTILRPEIENTIQPQKLNKKLVEQSTLRVNQGKSETLQTIATVKNYTGQLKNTALYNNRANNSTMQKTDSNNILLALHSIPIKNINSYNNTFVHQPDIREEIYPQKIEPTENIGGPQVEFLSMSNWIKKKFVEQGKNNLIEKEKPFPTDDLRIDPMTLASVGAGIVERTTGTKVSITRSYHKNGTIKSYAFAAGKFKFERVKKASE